MGCGARQSGPPRQDPSSTPLLPAELEDIWSRGVRASQAPEAMGYLADRGVSREIMDQMECLFLRYQGDRVFFPLYRDRKVVGLHGRIITVDGAPSLEDLGHGHPEQAPPSPRKDAGEEGEDPTPGQHPMSVGRSPCLASQAAFDPPAGDVTPIIPALPSPVKGVRKYWTIGEDGVWLPRFLYKPADLFVCEGIFDAIYFWPNGVAICGPEETGRKIRTLLGLHPGRIILVGDNDEASDLRARAALWRKEDRSMTIETLLPPADAKDFGEILERRCARTR